MIRYTFSLPVTSLFDSEMIKYVEYYGIKHDTKVISGKN